MIDAVTSATTNSASATMKQSIGMNKDDFLSLFVTQLKNQDPLNPMDGTEFIGQLAQLTQVEQAYNTNSNLGKLIGMMNDSSALSSVSYIGKDSNRRRFRGCPDFRRGGELFPMSCRKTAEQVVVKSRIQAVRPSEH